MNKQQEAEEYWNQFVFRDDNNVGKEIMDAYLAGHSSRDGEVEALKKENERRKKIFRQLHREYVRLSQTYEPGKLKTIEEFIDESPSSREKELHEALREVLRLMKERRHEVAGLGACITIIEVALMKDKV